MLTAQDRITFKAQLAEFDDAGGIKALADDLIALSETTRDYVSLPPAGTESRYSDNEPSIDCRLRYHDGAWSFITGDSSYDLDHRGHWGSSSAGADLERDSAIYIAEDLVDQVLESIATSEVQS